MAQQGVSPRPSWPGWLRQSASPAFAQARRRGASAGRRAEAGQRGAGLGRGEARRAVLRDAGWAGFGRGPEVRRRPAKEEKAFFICIFKEFLNAIFQILF